MMRRSLHCANSTSAPFSGSGRPPPSSTRPAKRDVIGGARRDQGGAAGEDQPRRAAHADQLRPARQGQAADAIIARTEHQRHAGAARSCRSPPAACCSARRRRRRARRVALHRRRRMESGAAPAGVAKVATEAAPVKAETVRRRRRSIFMTCSAANPEQTVQVSGQEMRAAMAQNRRLLQATALTPHLSRNGKRTHARQRGDSVSTSTRSAGDSLEASASCGRTASSGA